MSDTSSIVDGDDAAAFVESVMSSQGAVRIDTPVVNSKKRPAKSPVDLEDSEVKKPRHTVRRTLIDDVPTPAPRNTDGKVSITEADIHVDGEASVEQLIRKLSSDMHMLFTSLSERVDKLESSLEQRISSKVSQLLDKRVNTELNRIRKDVDDKIDFVKETLRADIADDITELRSRVDSIAGNQGQSSHDHSSDIAKNIVIRGLLELHNENIVTRVNELISEGLRLRDVKCARAERKHSSVQSKPGVIIAQFTTIDDKRRVMSRKSDLKGNRQFGDVFIDHDQTYTDRLMASNFRTILKSVKCQGLSVRGTRVVNNGYRDNNDGNSSGHNNNSNNRRNNGNNYNRRNDNNNYNRRNNDNSNNGQNGDNINTRRNNNSNNGRNGDNSNDMRNNDNRRNNRNGGNRGRGAGNVRNF